MLLPREPPKRDKPSQLRSFAGDGERPTQPRYGQTGRAGQGPSHKRAVGFLLPRPPLGSPMATSTGGGPTMSSRRTATAALAVGFILACAGSAGAQDHATPQEVVQRVQQAAQAVAKQ